MENQQEYVVLNGHKMSVRRAHSIMFVQCHVLGKKYDMNPQASPLEVTIHGYEPDGNDLKPDADDAGDSPTAVREYPPVVKRCNDCGGKK